ncbi:hypothetical protein DLAC_03269 [Tieghemostelium lacteum]|uniref:Fe2OG dioxygenase domain-containing protein n=1 Tax=Tieghemostelium lacteum TaxID=361077 RepID=A0A152A1P5_TIELA|nr:hypothetical protein DLAC_03269 [Tieghemostelium lacteum]|eukprot:KYR00119.1 hypothetical protein DLAC_03269 [Tieghemostelium lacteum]
MTDGNAMHKIMIEGQEVQKVVFPNVVPKDARPIVKYDIPELQPNVCFILENVLSPSECKHMINEGERIGFGDLQYYSRKYRDNQRILVHKNSTLASNYLAAPKGNWSLLGLNELWRLCKYTENGKFAAHFDGLYVKDKITRSFLTFMIYLNGDVDGGNTRFLSANIERAYGKVIARVEPKVGSVLVFQHDLYHDGDVVKSGLKYIIRSDVMYQLEDQNVAKEKLAIEREAREILNQAIEAEKNDPNLSILLYKKAFRMCPDLEKIV